MVYVPKHDVMSSLPPPVTALPTQSTFLLRIDERTQSKDPLHTPDAATERLTEWPLTSKGTASNGGNLNPMLRPNASDDGYSKTEILAGFRRDGVSGESLSVRV